MALFSGTKEKIERMEKSLQLSFFGVKKDISDVKSQMSNSLVDVRNNLYVVSQWLKYFQHKASQQDAVIEELTRNLMTREDVREEMRSFLDQYDKLSPLLERMNALEARINELSKGYFMPESKHSPGVQSELNVLQQRIMKLEERKLGMREKIMKKIARNSKEYVKSVILSYIRKYEKISAVRLKEMVVEEQGLCSKSSFYRMLEELENDDDIGVVKSNKEKHYFFKISRKI